MSAGEEELCALLWVALLLHWASLYLGEGGGRRHTKPKFLSVLPNDLQDVKLLRDTFDPLYCHT